MELEVPRVWFAVSMRLLPDRTVLVNGTDDAERRWTGRRDGPGADLRTVDVPGSDGPFVVRVPSGLEAAIGSAVAELPLHRSGQSALVAVPVFLSLPAGLEQLGWEEVGPALFPSVPPERLAVVVRGRAAAAMPSLRLPLRLLLVGDVGRDLLDDLLARSSWFRRDGLAEPVWLPSADAADQLRRGARFDAVVSDGWAADELASRTARHRLGIVVDRDPAPARPGPVPVNLARSTLSIREEFPVPVLTGFFEHLVHDIPLHEATAVVRATRPGAITRLTSTPDAVHDLRLADVLGEVARAGRELEGRIGPDPSRAAIATAVDWTRAVIDFSRESGGLYPLGEARALLSAAESTVADIPEATAPTAERVTDIALRRGVDVFAVTDDAFVQPTWTLQARATYHLDLHIGHRARDSLVVGEQPPIDPLLPDSRTGHDLEVVVFPGSFEVAGQLARPLHLPPAGASDTLSFALTVADRGPAWLRVCVLHRDHLLQTYLLTAEVTAREEARPDVVTAARMDHGSTLDWTDLSRYRSRALSLVLNAGIDGSHRVFVVSKGTHLDFPLGEGFQTAAVTPLRDTLAASARNEIPPDVALRRLARHGRKAWSGLFEWLRGDDWERFREIGLAAGEVLQITRTPGGSSVPWCLLYDWLLPEDVESAEICWGRSTENPEAPCAHGVESRVACVRGFWGVRHQVEERLGERTGNLRDRIALRDGRLDVDLAIGLPPASKEIAGLLSDLGEFTAPARLGAGDKLLERLWDTARRAPVAAVLGHHVPADQSIECGTHEKHLTAGQITDRAQVAGRWLEPAPVVLLLACESGAVLPTTVTSHVSALTAVGATAIVATECVVRTSRARGFAVHFLRELISPDTTVGAAIRTARGRMLADRDLAGLAFVAFGFADAAAVTT